jgi:hypothetical protein
MVFFSTDFTDLVSSFIFLNCPLSFAEDVTLLFTQHLLDLAYLSLNFAG